MLRLIFVCVILALPFRAAAQQPVGLELVLAMDVSTSVNEVEFQLQQFGLAGALLDPVVQQAIEASGGVAVLVAQWAGEGAVVTSVDWTLIETRQQAVALADRIAAAPRLVRGFTNIDGAILYAQAAIADNAFSGNRRVIDVSGDGTASNRNPAYARNQAVAAGITVNGLVVLVEDIDLGILADEDTYNHYRDFVIGGPGAFLIKADGFEDFARAMREKLLREIRGPLLSALPRGIAEAGGLSHLQFAK